MALPEDTTRDEKRAIRREIINDLMHRWTKMSLQAYKILVRSYELVEYGKELRIY